MDRETFCPICGDETSEMNGKWICQSEPDRHTYVFYEGDPRLKLEISRKVAIEYIIEALYSDEDGGYEIPDFDNMTNEQIQEEMCCSGMIHDSNFGKIT